MLSAFEGSKTFKQGILDTYGEEGWFSFTQWLADYIRNPRNFPKKKKLQRVQATGGTEEQIFYENLLRNWRAYVRAERKKSQHPRKRKDLRERKDPRKRNLIQRRNVDLRGVDQRRDKNYTSLYCLHIPNVFLCQGDIPCSCIAFLCFAVPYPLL